MNHFQSGCSMIYALTIWPHNLCYTLVVHNSTVVQQWRCGNPYLFSIHIKFQWIHSVVHEHNNWSRAHLHRWNTEHFYTIGTWMTLLGFWRSDPIEKKCNTWLFQNNAGAWCNLCTMHAFILTLSLHLRWKKLNCELNWWLFRLFRN